MARTTKKQKTKLESEILKEICEWLFSNGYFFWRANNTPQLGRFGANGEVRFRSLPKYTPRGVPDIICLHKGKFIGLEVKRPGMQLSTHQVGFGVRVALAGGKYEVVHSLEEVAIIFANI